MALWRKRTKQKGDGPGVPPARLSADADDASDAPTVLQPLDTPRSVSPTTIGQDGMFTLLATGIVNPFGPTLNVLAIDGDPEPGRQLPVIRVLLNPFTQEAETIGLARIGGTWDLASGLPRFFDSIAGSCPTVLMPSAMLDDDEAISLCSEFLQVFDDAFGVLERVRRFPGDPWNRIEKEVGGLGDVLRQAELGEETGSQQRALTEGEARELATNLLEEENLKQELAAFFYAWSGSIEFQSGSLAKNALALEGFAGYFSVIAPSCRVPEMDD